LVVDEADRLGMIEHGADGCKHLFGACQRLGKALALAQLLAI